MIDIKQVKAIRRRLKRAWSPFFARFGSLTPIQIETVPKILNGINVVVASPTASGKTEAVVAPLAELFVTNQWEELAILYIVPTRALANDLLTRIEGPLWEMGINAALKHGDSPYLGRTTPNLLITTPESFDSLLSRHPQLLTYVKAVVLDEIHLLDNTSRGDQLRVLLHRLRQLLDSRSFTIHILSATLSEPEQIASRYVDTFEIVTAPGRREIEYQFFATIQEIYDLARKNRYKKILCFCNKRETVETVAAELGELWQPYPVVAHHGSLGRDQRLEAETVMKESPVAVCVSTSTLEIGVDIGDIDLVVLYEMPWSLSSLLQRIGRGNRRSTVIQTAAIVTTETEKDLLDAMFQASITGTIPVEPYQPDLSVAVQQIFSCLFQHPYGLAEPTIENILGILCSSPTTKHILAHLSEKGWIEWRTGHWCASSKLMDLGEMGRIHSNIPDSDAYQVIDVDSGREIGRIVGIFDNVFVLARSTWQVVSVDGVIIKARRLKQRGATPLFRSSGNKGTFYYLLPAELRQ